MRFGNELKSFMGGDFAINTPQMCASSGQGGAYRTGFIIYKITVPESVMNSVLCCKPSLRLGSTRLAVG
jgi:hypothetical protein